MNRLKSILNPMCVLGRWGQVGGACHLEQMEAGGKREKLKKKNCVLFFPLASVSQETVTACFFIREIRSMAQLLSQQQQNDIRATQKFAGRRVDKDHCEQTGLQKTGTSPLSHFPKPKDWQSLIWGDYLLQMVILLMSVCGG